MRLGLIVLCLVGLNAGCGVQSKSSQSQVFQKVNLKQLLSVDIALDSQEFDIHTSRKECHAFIDIEKGKRQVFVQDIIKKLNEFLVSEKANVKGGGTAITESEDGIKYINQSLEYEETGVCGVIEIHVVAINDTQISVLICFFESH